MPEIKLVITHKNKVVKSVNKETGENFVKTLENFQVKANNILTNMIQDLGESAEEVNMNEDEGSQSDEEDFVWSIAKKRKK